LAILKGNFYFLFAAKPACRPGREKLEIVKDCGEAAAAACLPRPSAAGEAENSFELYSEYTANFQNLDLR